MFCNQLAHLLDGQLTGGGHAWDLPDHRVRRQAVIQPARGGGDQLNRHLTAGLRIRSAQGGNAFSNGFVQVRVTARQIAAAGGHWIIRAFRSGGRASLEVAWVRKVLPNQTRAAVFTVLDNQRAVGLILKPPLAQRGSHQRVKPAGNQRQQNKQQYSGT